MRKSNSSSPVFFGDQIKHRIVDMVAIGDDFLNRRACQQATIRPWIHSTDRIKIRIQDIVEILVKPVVGFRVFLENEALEKPRDMREMPFRRADVRHTLHDVVLGLEVLTQRDGCIADVRILRRRRICGDRCLNSVFSGSHLEVLSSYVRKTTERPGACQNAPSFFVVWFAPIARISIMFKPHNPTAAHVEQSANF